MWFPHFSQQSLKFKNCVWEFSAPVWKMLTFYIATYGDPLLWKPTPLEGRNFPFKFWHSTATVIALLNMIIFLHHYFLSCFIPYLFHCLLWSLHISLLLIWSVVIMKCILLWLTLLHFGSFVVVSHLQVQANAFPWIFHFLCKNYSLSLPSFVIKYSSCVLRLHTFSYLFMKPKKKKKAKKQIKLESWNFRLEPWNKITGNIDDF